MTVSQRTALLDLCRAICAVKHGPAEIHARAEALENKLDRSAWISRMIMGR